MRKPLQGDPIAPTLFIAPAIFVIGLFLLLLLWLCLEASRAQAHDAPLGWSYPWSCCSSQDCRQTTGGEVRETPTGYLIVGTGETVPYQDKRIKDSPDGETHWCAHQAGLDAGHTICLFVPPKGF
jgi:hypothetical protein